MELAEFLPEGVMRGLLGQVYQVGDLLSAQLPVVRSRLGVAGEDAKLWPPNEPQVGRPVLALKFNCKDRSHSANLLMSSIACMITCSCMGSLSRGTTNFICRYNDTRQGENAMLRPSLWWDGESSLVLQALQMALMALMPNGGVHISDIQA